MPLFSVFSLASGVAILPWLLIFQICSLSLVPWELSPAGVNQNVAINCQQLVVTCQRLAFDHRLSVAKKNNNPVYPPNPEKISKQQNESHHKF